MFFWCFYNFPVEKHLSQGFNQGLGEGQCYTWQISDCGLVMQPHTSHTVQLTHTLGCSHSRSQQPLPHILLDTPTCDRDSSSLCRHTWPPPMSSSPHVCIRYAHPQSSRCDHTSAEMPVLTHTVIESQMDSAACLAAVDATIQETTQ
jgi:hypothetical protein